MMQTRKEKLREMCKTLKETARHDWKYHKASTIAYFYGLAIFVGIAILAVQAFRLKVTLPDYMLTGVVMLMAAWMIYQFFCRVSDLTREEEQEKEDKLFRRNKQ